MANIKKIILMHTETGITTYCIIRREADEYLLDDLTGDFSSSPTDPYLSLIEDGTIKGLYEISENRQIWNNGRYSISAYKQSGGSPSPIDDTIIGRGDMYIVNDTEIVLNNDINTVLTEINANEAKIDIIDTNIDTLNIDMSIVQGLLHKNVKYTSPVYDSDNNLTSVLITIYTDNTLTTPITSFTWTAVGDGAGKFSSAQQVEN